MILAKLALGAVGTLAFATVYTFREGTIRVDVDEHRPGGSHVHVWVPAALVPAAMHFVPDDKLLEAACHAREALPIVKIVAAELENYPNADFTWTFKITAMTFTLPYPFPRFRTSSKISATAPTGAKPNNFAAR